MPRLADTVRETLGTYWNVILPLAYGGLTTTETTTFIADFTAAAGGTFSFAESTATAVLYGYARRMFSAANVVQSLRPQDIITPDAIAVPPWARDEREMATLPIWHVHFDLTYTNSAGDIVTERKVTVFRMTFFDTMGELQDAVEADADAMARKYDGEFISADIKEIHSV